MSGRYAVLSHLAPAGIVEGEDVLTDILEDLRPGHAEVELFDHERARDIFEIGRFLTDADFTFASFRRSARLGITGRYVIRESVARHPAMSEFIAGVGSRVEWRVLRSVPQRLFLRDGIALVSLDPAAGRNRALASQGHAVRPWAIYAEDVWRKATAWTPEGAGRQRARRGVVVDLLLDGFDDEAIARRLSTSVRTVRRDVADLMAEHGAKSRLQLGAALATTR